MKINYKIIGKSLEFFFISLMVITTVWTILNWIFPNFFISQQSIDAAEKLYGFNFATLSLTTRCFMYFAGAIGTTILLYGLWTCAQISRLLSERKIISEAGARLFSTLRKISIYWGSFAIIQCSISFWLFMPKMEFKLKVLSLVFSGIGNLIIFVFFAILSSVISRAARLQSDQDLTV